jgi:hypothetical protein
MRKGERKIEVLKAEIKGERQYKQKLIGPKVM